MQRMLLAFGLVAALALPCLAQAPAVPAPATLSNDAITAAIDRARDCLLLRQQDDSWGAAGSNREGPTAFVADTLVTIGRLQRTDPQVQKAVAWIKAHRSDDVYSLAARCLLWRALYHTARQEENETLCRRDRDLLAQRVLHRSFIDQDDAGETVLRASRAAETLDRAGVEAAPLLWETIRDATARSQQSDGGWKGPDVPSRIRRTAAALVALCICDNYLTPSGQYATVGGVWPPPAIDRAAGWLDRHAPDLLAGRLRDDDLPTTLLLLQRAATVTGRWQPGGHDLFRSGAQLLLAAQNADGGWTGTSGDVSTACAMRFLAAQRTPVLLSHLKYDGDWNNRPQGLRHITDWCSMQMCCSPSRMAWQVLDIAAPLDQWPTSQTVLITGSRAPRFTDEDVARLREYLLRGGLVFSAAEGDGQAFTAGIRDLCARMFPEYPLAPCGNVPPILSTALGMTPERWKLVRLSVLSNGVRPLVVHSEADLPLAWQQREAVRKPHAFVAVLSTLLYSRHPFLSRPTRCVAPWPEEPKFEPRLTVTVARLDAAPGAGLEPLAWERLRRLMGREHAVKVDVTPPMAVAKLAASGARLAVLSGTKEFTLGNDDAAALKKYVDGGGTLLVEPIGGSPEFRRAAEAMLDQLFGARNLPRLPKDHALFQMKGLVIDWRYTLAARGGDNTASGEPPLHGIFRGDRLAVIVSDLDLTEGLLGCTGAPVAGFQPDTAMQLARNLVLYAAGHR